MGIGPAPKAGKGRNMDAKAQAQAILSEFARGIELEELSLDERDSCRLAFDRDLLVDIDYDPQGQRFVLSGALGSPAEAAARDVYEAALRGNALWPEGAGTIAIDGASGQLVLLREVAVPPLDGRSLALILGGFVEAARGWRELVAGAAERPAAAAPEQGVGEFAIRA
jgi:hypothetical protein